MLVQLNKCVVLIYKEGIVVIGVCLICDVCSWRCSFMGSMCVSSCRCCVFVSVVHAVAILSVVVC